ncbi:hypothetical protein NECAME_07837 [Necator americanus]|uniref:Uncharacterized protein n=1 Tax=Necator americanus TaxID=51031 RepID=W2TNM4_NECAM|nr:hypothetical protein NECAME_07837 [Necator americanus]ETN82726.1 hypothetical protein NECAME_07837 [Necator americanus]
MQRVLLIILVAACSAKEEENIKEEIAAGYFSPQQSDSSYGYSFYKYEQATYNPPSYQQPFYQPQLMMPPFALPSYDDRDHRHHHGHRLRKFERQSCRYTAVFSWEACNNCCKVASRTNGNAQTRDIVGALFVFDPDMDFRRHDDEPEHSKNKAVQCVCCAPKRF